MMLLFVALPVSGCATINAGNYCDHASVITYTSADWETMSDQLVRQLVRHNETVEALCGGS